MSGICLITKGFVCQPVVQRYLLPLNFNVSRNVIKLNLKNPLPNKINIKNSNVNNLNIKISNKKINIVNSTTKLNIKKICG